MLATYVMCNYFVSFHEIRTFLALIMRGGHPMSFFRNWLHRIRKCLMREYILWPIKKGTRQLIVYLTPGFDWRCGGVRAIAMHFKEARRISSIHGARVLLAILPGDPWLLKYTWFSNKFYLIPFKTVLERYRKLDWLMLHVPEYAINQFLSALTSEQLELLSRTPHVHINVMLQNIDQMEGQNISALGKLGKVTCTTAHEAYCSERIRHELDVPLHPLIGCVDKGKFFFTTYEMKENLLVVSPDRHPLKEKLLARIREFRSDLQIQIISDLSYDDYKRLISRAKWSLTFGEGLDNYFCEPTLSGSVGFAVYNDRFFTTEWLALENIYNTWDEFETRILSDLQRLDNPQAYHQCWSRSFELLGKHDINSYRVDLERFYRGDYALP